ncbi:MAG: FG-GAP repeat protein [Leptospiraceae bacterium]|nr:FG-GAP repeat protein [Leptospiraceae bacterium]
MQSIAKYLKKIIVKFLILFIFLFTFTSCPEQKKNIFGPDSPFAFIMSIILGLQNKPMFSPASGRFTEAVTVKIANSKNNPGLPIYYTTNGIPANCSSTKYDTTKGVVLDLGRIYTLNAVECFEGIPSSLGSAEYSVGFCQNYTGIFEGRLRFIRDQFSSYSPIPIDGSYKYSITPALNSCLGINSDSGAISGTCPTTISEQEYRVTRALLTGNKENFSCLAKIGVYEWINEAYLKAPNGEANDIFGTAVAISGDTIVVGARLEASNQTTITNGITSAGNGANNSGAAYVFRRTGTTWTNEAYLKAPNAELNDYFGSLLSLSISGDTIVVGVSQEDSVQTTITNGTLVQGNDAGTNKNSGAAYVFRRTGTTWINEAYLKAPNAGTTDDFFGTSVSISEDTIVAGATGEDSNQTTITNGSTASSDNSASNSGAAYVFRRSGTIWTNEAYLKAPNAGSSDFFGTSVSISGDTIVVGAINEDSNQTTITNGTTGSSDNLAFNPGAIYVFRRTGTIWANEAYIKAPNAEGVNPNGDNFGTVVSISGDTIVVGAPSEDSLQTTITNGTLVQANDGGSVNAGAVYVFRRTGNIWANEAYLKASNAEAADSFGTSISISGDTIVVGATGEDSNQTTITNGTLIQASDQSLNTNQGAAYVFRRIGVLWVQDAYLKAPNAEASDNFGVAVSISGDTIVVGAQSEGSAQTTITNGTTNAGNGASQSGAAYVFRLK